MYHAQLGRFVSRDPAKQQWRKFDLYAYVRNCPTRYIDPSGLLERAFVPPAELGDFGAFQVNWSFSLDEPYDDEVVLIQRIKVSLRLEACGGRPCRPKICNFTYVEEVGRVPGGLGETSVRSTDNWTTGDGFASAFFRYHDSMGAGESRPTCGRVIMRGEVRVFKLDAQIEGLLRTWERHKQYNDNSRGCYRYTWTAGGFPSSSGFRYWTDRQRLVEQEGEPKEVRAIWNCDNPKTELTGVL